MADVITRFRIESTQYDSKLRDAAKALAGISKQAEMAGKDFAKFANNNVEAARSLGAIASGATNTKDRLKDLVGAYNDVAKAYNNLTDQQKQSDFAKAMAQSLGQLQDRIKETKEELYSLGNASKGGGLFGEGGLTGMLQVAGGNLISKGLTSLVSGLTDSIQKSIELAREGEGVRLAFERLNQPGLLDRLKEATHGTVSEVELMKQAVKFENFKLPLEDLANYLAFAQQKAKDTGDSVDNMVNSIVNGLGRQSKQILDNLGISAAELTKRMNEGATMTQAVSDIIREEMAKAGDYVETAAERAARAAAKATDEMEKFGQQAAPIAEEWGQTWNALSIGAMNLANILLGPLAESIRQLQNLWNNGWEDNIINSPYNIEGKTPPRTGYQGMGNLQKVTAPGGYVVVSDKNTGEVIGGQHFDNLSDTNSIKDWKKGLFKTSKGGKGSNKQPTMADFQKYMTKAALGADDLKPNDAKEFLSPYQMMLPEIKKNILDIKDADLGGAFAKIGDQKVQKEIENMNKALDQQKMAFNMAGQAAQNFGAALASIEDPGAKAAGTVISAIANIALGFSQAAAQASSMGPYGWIAYVAAGLATMATAISTVHSLTGYAQGGIVKGNSYSGDNMMFGGDGLYGLNAGELVLTRAQQNSLANQLEGNGIGNLNLHGVLQGENILISIDRTLQRQGRELAVWGRGGNG